MTLPKVAISPTISSAQITDSGAVPSRRARLRFSSTTSGRCWSMRMCSANATTSAIPAATSRSVLSR